VPLLVTHRNLAAEARYVSGGSRSRRELHDGDGTVLLGLMQTPVIGFVGLRQLHRVDSEGWHVCSVRVDLHDVPWRTQRTTPSSGPGPIQVKEQTGHFAIACAEGT
jgi:hypothetical protein